MRIHVLVACLLFAMLLHAASAHFGSTTTGDIVAYSEPHEPPRVGENTTIYFDIVRNGTHVSETILSAVEVRVIDLSDNSTSSVLRPVDFSDGLTQANDGVAIVHYVFPRQGQYDMLVQYNVSDLTASADIPIPAQGPPLSAYMAPSIVLLCLAVILFVYWNTHAKRRKK